MRIVDQLARPLGGEVLIAAWSYTPVVPADAGTYNPPAVVVRSDVAARVAKLAPRRMSPCFRRDDERESVLRASNGAVVDPRKDRARGRT
jgi:hypothetical protein